MQITKGKNRGHKSFFKRKIYVKFTSPYSQLSCSGNWIDVTAVEMCTFNNSKNFESINIPLGIITEMPKYYRAELKFRSSTCNNYGILQRNAVGEIEPDFGDEWKLPIITLPKFNRTFKFISPGDRLAQINFSLKSTAPWYEKIRELFIKQEIIIVDEVTSTRGGFGSTGK